MLFILKTLNALSRTAANARANLARKLCTRSSRKASKLRHEATATAARGVETIIAMRDMHDEELDALRTKQAMTREVYRAVVWDAECALIISADAAQTKAAKYAEHI